MMSYFQDGGHDFISFGKVLPSGECALSVCSAHMQERPPVVIISTFVLIFCLAIIINRDNVVLLGYG